MTGLVENCRSDVRLCGRNPIRRPECRVGLECRPKSSLCPHCTGNLSNSRCAFRPDPGQCPKLRKMRPSRLQEKSTAQGSCLGQAQDICRGSFARPAHRSNTFCLLDQVRSCSGRLSQRIEVYPKRIGAENTLSVLPRSSLPPSTPLKQSRARASFAEPARPILTTPAESPLPAQSDMPDTKSFLKTRVDLKDNPTPCLSL